MGLFLLVQITNAQAQVSYQITAEPDWINEQAIDPLESVPEAEISSGVYYQLVDIQIKADSPKDHWYFKAAIKIVSRQGLENASQFSFTFDPSYEKAELHSIQIIREGQIQDRLDRADIRILQREEELEYHLYDGSQSLTAFVDDVRIGDILVYSYSVIGSNPVFEGRFFGSIAVSFSEPVGTIQRRILWPNNRTLHYKIINNDQEPEVTQKDHYVDYIWRWKNQPIIRGDSNLPSWYSPYGLLQLSEMDSWREVVNWSLPLYEPDRNPTGELKQQIDRIAAISEDAGQRTMEVLKFVQGEIRYLGIELGVGSHAPRPASTTLQNRYGDCKDKTMLMVSMLQAMDIEAVPAFVDTTEKGQIANYLPSPAIFNHVIVKATIKGQTYWFDPTLTQQMGTLATHTPPDYRLALAAAKDTIELEEIPTLMLSQPTIVTEDEIDLSGGINQPASLNTKTTYRGSEADNMRRYFAGKGLSRVGEDYVSYYARFYDSIELDGGITFEDDPVANIITAHESYRVVSPWKYNESDRTDSASIYAYSLFDNLSNPAKQVRSMPLAVSFPGHQRHKIKMIMPADFVLESESAEIDDVAFTFRKKTKFQDPVYYAEYDLVMKRDHVLAEEAATHIANIEKARDEAGLGFYMDRENTSVQASEVPIASRFSIDDIAAYSFLLFLLIGVIVAIIAFIHGSRSDQPWTHNMRFYPISLLKFVLLSLVTLGLYNIYWFHKNWQYYRDKYNEKVWPFWRAVFGVIWFYSLLTKIRKEGKDQDVINGKLVILLPILYFFLSLVGIITDHVWLALIWVILCILPLPAVIAVNRMNDMSGIAFKRNSRFGPMATLGLISGTPIMLYVLASALHLNVAGELTNGRHLMPYHKEYLIRLGVLEKGEILESFYSDGFITIETDGSLITDQGVAFYWQDENGRIQTIKTGYEEFTSVTLVDQGSILESSLIRVETEAGDYIQFYWPTNNNEDSKLITLLRSRMKNFKSEGLVIPVVTEIDNTQ